MVASQCVGAAQMRQTEGEIGRGLDEMRNRLWIRAKTGEALGNLRTVNDRVKAAVVA